MSVLGVVRGIAAARAGRARRVESFMVGRWGVNWEVGELTEGFGEWGGGGLWVMRGMVGLYISPLSDIILHLAPRRH